MCRTPVARLKATRSLTALFSSAKRNQGIQTSTPHPHLTTATMGWFWGSSSPSGDDDKAKDPLRNLDPSLREFLKKESPVKYDSSNPPATSQPQRPVASTPQPSERLPSKTPAASLNPSSPETQSEPKIPAQSLYQDGRYAHLWKTYQSQHDIEAANKSDQEKIDDVLEGYKYRKAEIGRAALENCALEQWEVNDCFRNGGWASRLTMCKDENRELQRCYNMQGVCGPYFLPIAVKLELQCRKKSLGWALGFC